MVDGIVLGSCEVQTGFIDLFRFFAVFLTFFKKFFGDFARF